MPQYGVYAQNDTTPLGYRAIVSVFPPLIGDGPGQKSLFEWVQQVVPSGQPFGIFEYPSEAYPENYDFDAWYPAPEEMTAGIGTQEI